MALRNPKLFGLNVFSALADVVDKEQSLNSLNLSSRDLDIIRGSQNAGATSGDWISLSRLTDQLYRTLDRYKTDSEEYGTLLDARAGTEKTLFGNLNINGILSGNAVRYRYLDGTGLSGNIKIADISTSRVSAWSSVGVGTTVPISYGAQVSIRSGGALQFGTQSGTTGPRLQTSLTPQEKEFDSEFPTSKITCTIGGQSVVLYAMKGIPLIFTGFFRNLNASIRLTAPLINNTPPSWKIVETANPNNFTNFKNKVSGTTSSINFRSSVSRERYIQFYYNPDNISTITLTSANITELPAVKLQNATELNFSNNQLRNFPNFKIISPTLQSLNLNNNPLSKSGIGTERKLNSAVLNKIPTSVRDLYLAKTFYGSIQQNIIATGFPNLKILHLSRTDDTGPYYHPDVDDADCQLPNVPDTCETYSVSRNDFRTFGTSVGIASCVSDLTKLISLDVSRNWNLGVVGPFSIATNNNVIQSISSHYTNLPLPTGLSGKNSFTTLYHYWCRSAGPLVNDKTYLYDNCNSLSTLHLYGSNVTGRLPKFTNAALRYLDLRLTNLTGGGPTDSDDDTNYVIPERTFEKCIDLVWMLIQSPLLLDKKDIHPNVFSYTPNLYYLWYTSYGRTTGNIPNLTSNSKLEYLVLHYNKFDGPMPSFTSNSIIRYINISYNALSGEIPPLKNLQNLNRLLVYNNQFTSLSTFTNLNNLQYFYAQSNKLSGEIPSFAGCPNLLYLILFNNSLTDYKTGGLATNYRLSYLDLSVNSLSGQAVNQIIADLLLNYNTVNRGGVTVNLRGGNALPSGVALDSIAILRSKGWSIVYN